MRIKVIGIGGIGGCLLPVLLKFVGYSEDITAEIVLVDGDVYERGNLSRQFFTKIGNKADVTAERLKDEFSETAFESVCEYVTEDNVDAVIREGDYVFLCVDNHATRKLVSDRCEELKDVVLISGGNDLTDGNVQVYVRSNEENVTLPLTNYRHPEIASPKDKNPNDMGCEELSHSEPQLIITNNMVAAMMLNCFYTHLQEKLNYSEVYVDVVTANCRPVPIEQSEPVEVEALNMGG